MEQYSIYRVKIRVFKTIVYMIINCIYNIEFFIHKIPTIWDNGYVYKVLYTECIIWKLYLDYILSFLNPEILLTWSF